MDRVSVTVSVFFEEPFWVGLVERITDGKLVVCKVTFGTEPRDYDVNRFLQENYYRLRFSPAVENAVKDFHVNPKRMRRQIKKQLKDVGTGTKSQQALKLQQEQSRTERKVSGRERKEAEQLRKFALKQQKKKEKHRGR
ncbi:YjdF family protein [Ruminococcus sp. OA3]|uniref:YjdF family protein n=1 Tax=Ruminococcus sp. OA3 TaxID=2914164 RepID=UPI001F05EE98|nr:YjdF family protein [Ruminococcus sp. OA3]MCH1981174.1 YjdF family protein [Ruminococcus sp. OA3]